MNKTPNSHRTHITFIGKRNVGKSSLINALTNQEISVVSNQPGTTTDPVKKAMELIPVGPVLLIDTAGIDDEGQLGNKRVQKTIKILEETDYAIFIEDICSIDKKNHEKTKQLLKKYNIPYIVVMNKTDLASKAHISKIQKEYKDAICINSFNKKDILTFKNKVIDRLKNFSNTQKTLIGDIVPYNGKVILVVPIDSEAPKGRLILPQVQLIRDCLDNGIKSYVTRDTELCEAIDDLKDIDLVVTDSQAFKEVSKIVPDSINLTSFSIVLSRTKGDLPLFIENVKKLDKLKSGSNILISESCTHNSTCDDIGRIKIPKLIEKYTKKTFNYDIYAGKDFPKNLSEYDFAIHCAACMLNRKNMQFIISKCQKINLPITNYGVLLSYLNGILNRATKCFKKNEEMI